MSFCLGKRILGGRSVAPKPQDACALPRKSKMGRPKTNEPRTHQLNLSFTANEIESIRNRALALGLRPAHFGRILLLNKDSVQAKRAGQPNAIHRQVQYQLCRLGANLNQMLKRMHAFSEPVPPDLEPLLIDIRQLIAKLAP